DLPSRLHSACDACERRGRRHEQEHAGEQAIPPPSTPPGPRARATRAWLRVAWFAPGRSPSYRRGYRTAPRVPSADCRFVHEIELGSAHTTISGGATTLTWLS